MSDIMTGQLTLQMFVSYFNCFYRMQLNIFKGYKLFEEKKNKLVIEHLHQLKGKVEDTK